MSSSFKAKDRYGAEIEFEIVEINESLERESEMEYRKAYSAAIKEGILPREKMRNIFKENGIWTQEDEDKFTALVKDIALLNIKLEDATKQGRDDECIKIAGEMGKLRLEMLQLFTIQQSAYMQSCEGYAEIMRLESLLASRVVVKANKQRYWKTYKDYVIERDQNDRSTVATEAMIVNNSLLEKERDLVISEYPEQRWLKQLQKDLVDKATEKAKEELVRRVGDAANADENKDSTIKNDVSNQGTNN